MKVVTTNEAVLLASIVFCELHEPTFSTGLGFDVESDGKNILTLSLLYFYNQLPHSNLAY